MANKEKWLRRRWTLGIYPVVEPMNCNWAAMIGVYGGDVTRDGLLDRELCSRGDLETHLVETN